MKLNYQMGRRDILKKVSIGGMLEMVKKELLEMLESLE